MEEQARIWSPSQHPFTLCLLALVIPHSNSQCFTEKKIIKSLSCLALLLTPQVLSKLRRTSVPGLCLFNFMCTPAGTVGTHSVLKSRSHKWLIIRKGRNPRFLLLPWPPGIINLSLMSSIGLLYFV